MSNAKPGQPEYAAGEHKYENENARPKSNVDLWKNRNDKEENLMEECTKMQDSRRISIRTRRSTTKARETDENINQISISKYLPRDCCVKLSNITKISKSSYDSNGQTNKADSEKSAGLNKQLVSEERAYTEEESTKVSKKLELIDLFACGEKETDGNSNAKSSSKLKDASFEQNATDNDSFDQDTAMIEALIGEEGANDYNEQNHNNVINEEAFPEKYTAITVSDDEERFNTRDKNDITYQKCKRTYDFLGTQSELAKRKCIHLDPDVSVEIDIGMSNDDVIEVCEEGFDHPVDGQNEEDVGQNETCYDSMAKVQRSSSEAHRKSNFIEISSDEDIEVEYIGQDLKARNNQNVGNDQSEEVGSIEQDLVVDESKEVAPTFPLENVKYTFAYIELETMLASNSKVKEITQIGGVRKNPITNEKESFFKAIEPERLTQYLESYKLGGDLLQTLNMQMNDTGIYEFRKPFEIMEEGRVAIQCVNESEALEELAVYLEGIENCIIVTLSEENIELLVKRMKILNVLNKKIHLDTVKGFCTWSAYLKEDNASEEELGKDFEDWYSDHTINSSTSQGTDKHADVVAKMVHDAVEATKTFMEFHRDISRHLVKASLSPGFHRDISRHLVKASRPIYSLQLDMTSEEIKDMEIQYLEIFSSLRPDLPARITLVKLESYDICSEDEDENTGNRNDTDGEKKLKKEGLKVKKEAFKKNSLPDRVRSVTGIPTRKPVTGVPTSGGPWRYQGPRNDQEVETGWGGLPANPGPSVTRAPSERAPTASGAPTIGPQIISIPDSYEGVSPASTSPRNQDTEISGVLMVPVPTTPLPSPLNLFAARSPPLISIPGKLPLVTSILERTPAENPVPVRVPLITSVEVPLPTLVPTRVTTASAVPARVLNVTPAPERVQVGHQAPPARVSVVTPMPARAPVTTQSEPQLGGDEWVEAGWGGLPENPGSSVTCAPTGVGRWVRVAETRMLDLLELLKCPVCLKRFNSEEMKKQHIIAKHPGSLPENPGPSVTCSPTGVGRWGGLPENPRPSVTQERVMVAETQMQGLLELLKCPICLKRFNSEEVKKQHIIAKHPSSTACSLLRASTWVPARGGTFTVQSEFRTCPICSKSFNKEFARNQHIIDMDQSPILPVELQCPKCYVWMISPEVKLKHKCKSTISRIPLFLQCQKCLKYFNSFEEKTKHVHRCKEDTPTAAVLPSLMARPGFSSASGGCAGHNYPQSAGQIFPQHYGQNFPQNDGQNFPQNIGQMFSQNAGQNFPQNIGQNFSQNAGQNFSQNIGQNFSQNAGQNFPQNAGQNFTQRDCNQSRGWLSSPRRK